MNTAVVTRTGKYGYLSVPSTNYDFANFTQHFVSKGTRSHLMVSPDVSNMLSTWKLFQI